METNRKRFKQIALVLTLSLLFQSCAIYHRQPVTLEQAAAQKIKTKIWYKGEGREFPVRYTYIALENGQFFGVGEEELGEQVRVRLNPDEITKVRTRNKAASIWTTIGVCTAGVGILIYAAVANMSFGSGIGGI